MVVLKKRRVYQKPPDKHYFEQTVKDYDAFTGRQYGDLDEPKYDTHLPRTRPQLFAMSWGWNANSRAGNLTDLVVSAPSHVQHTKGHRFVSAAAAKHHSLLVSDEGIVYSVGEGSKGQLGYGNAFVETSNQFLRCYPKQITPSGEIEFDKDIRISQVGGGLHFSVARELSIEEGVDLVVGFRQLEKRMDLLYHMFRDSVPVQLSHAFVRHERHVINKTAQGRLLVWGDGPNGELGLGRSLMSLSHPTVINSLRGVCITQIAVGASHVLAITGDGILYSWGEGKGGRLGHKDFNSRNSPEKVVFFESFYVEQVAAGDAHSAVLTTNRKGLPRTEQIKRAVTFGRGAHGRLGNGKNRNVCTPVVVSHWPASIKGMQLKQIACGGAHTVLLAYRYLSAAEAMNRELANPWAITTNIYCWGYGANGQLGTGEMRHTFVPVRMRTPKWEIFCEISAGRSWTLARTISGDVYSCGKGMRGQLGLGKQKFCLAPEKIPNVMPFVRLSSNYAHNMGIAVPRKHLTPKITEVSSGTRQVLEYEYVNTRLQERVGQCSYAFTCCRRFVGIMRKQIRFICHTCKMSSICYHCAKLCHSGHQLALRNDYSGKCFADVEKARLAHLEEYGAPATEKFEIVNLGMLDLVNANDSADSSKKKPANDNSHAKSPKGKRSKKTLSVYRDHKRWMPYALTYYLEHPMRDPVEDVSRQDNSTSNRSRTNSKAPRLSRATVEKNKAAKRAAMALDPIDRQAERPYVPVPYCQCGVHGLCCKMLPTVMEIDEEEPVNIALVERNGAAHCIQRIVHKYLLRKATEKMGREMRQKRLQVCEQYWEKSILEPIWRKISVAMTVFRQEAEGNDMEIEDDNKRKYDYYLNLQNGLSSMDALLYALRALIGSCSVRIPSLIEMEQQVTARSTTFVAGSSENSTVSSIKLVQSASRPTFAFSWVSVRRQQRRTLLRLQLRADELRELTASIPRHDWTEGLVLDPDVNLYIGRYIRDIHREEWREQVAQAEAAKAAEKAARVAKALEILKLKKPDRKALFAKVAALNRPPPKGPPPAAARAAYRIKREAEKAEMRKKEIELLQAEEREVMGPFEQFAKKRLAKLERRQSVCDPCNMAMRISTLRSQVRIHSYAVRRNSLPANLAQLHPLERPPWAHNAGVMDSLSVYAERSRLLREFVEEEFDEMWENVSEAYRIKRMVAVLKLGWLTPRVPIDIAARVQDPERRRTIAEPERLAKQFDALCKTRKLFAQIRGRLRRVEKMPLRRRSFDYNEERDFHSGITDFLKLEYEENGKPSTTFAFKKDSANFDKILEDRNYGEAHQEIEDRVAAERYLSTTYVIEPLDYVSSNAMYAGSSTLGLGIKRSTSRCIGDSESEMRVWQEHYADDGKTYYYDPYTGESQWDYPQGAEDQVETQYQDEASGAWYWFNSTTGEAKWM